LLAATTLNPTPTTVPPPIAALAGNIGERHVLVFLGLPLVGKRTIALRLKRYLRFFHGARVKAFDIAKQRESDDGSARAPAETTPESRGEELFVRVREFLESTDELPPERNDDDRARPTPPGDVEQGGQSGAGGGSNGGSRRVSAATRINGIAPLDKNAKNVDSGRVAIVFSSDALATFYDNWSGSSKERRRWIENKVDTITRESASRLRVKTIFIEVTLTKSHFERNILRQKIERDVREGALRREDAESAAGAWKSKVAEYRKLHVTLQDDGSEDDLSFIKLINYGERVLTNRMRAYLPQRIVQFLTATHPTRHTIYLCRHGESEYNKKGRLGGNSPLTDKGWAFAEILAEFAATRVCGLRRKKSPAESLRAWEEEERRRLESTDAFQAMTRLGLADDLRRNSVDAASHNAAIVRQRSLSATQATQGSSPRTSSGGPLEVEWEERPPDDPEGPTRCARLWTSSLLRTIQTAALIPHPIVRGPDGTPNAWEEMSPRVYRNIDEIFAGDCEGLTPEEMEKAHPQTATLRKTDKIGFRYPRGESYFDLISRLEPCIQEMESYAEPLLIVSHQAILRLIFAYLTGVDREKAPLMLDAIHQNVVYQIDLDASSESHITGDAETLPKFVKVWDFREEVERRVAEEGRKRKEREGEKGGGDEMV
jgi:broad specificity phosphatase PhoE